MSDLSDLYQEVILDHNRRPRNFGEIEGARSLEGYNPLCGDRITVYVKAGGDRIDRVTFKGTGCAISRASASVMTETVSGKSRAQVDAAYEKFHRLVTEGGEVDVMVDGEIAALSGVSRFPMRVKCATLAWHTLRALLEDRKEPVSTE